MKRKFEKFMYGRNGSDELTILWMIITVVFMLAALVLLLFDLSAASIVLYFTAFILLLYCIFRVFSKNISQRRAENEKLLFFKKRIKERKEYKYKKCPECDSWLRFPRQKGEHVVVCPRCKSEIKIKIR